MLSYPHGTICRLKHDRLRSNRVWTGTLRERAGGVGTEVTGHRTIVETARVTVLDLPAMEAVAAVHRASGALRSRAERKVLGPHRLTWTTWVVLQIVSVWKEIETRHVASEAGISK